MPEAGFDREPLSLNLPTATGRVEGHLWHQKSDKKNKGIWAFAEGHLANPLYHVLGGYEEREILKFQADENGRFQVDDVPVGLNRVVVPYQVHDVVYSLTWSALVEEGQTTAMRGFDPDGHREFTLAIEIGDGSKAQYESGTGLGASRKVDNVTLASRLFSSDKEPSRPREPMFQVDLEPISKGPLWFADPDWQKLDAHRKVILPDVGPGTYRLRLYDWLGRRDFGGGQLFDGEVIVPPGGGGEVRIPLGAGCITGKISETKESYLHNIEVTALAKAGNLPARRAYCDLSGNFCVRYLAPGTYSLFIHDPEAGFCRVDDVVVPAGVVDVGERTLSAGASIRGEIRFARPSPVPDAVVAIGPSGVSLRRELEVYSSFDRVDLAGLWPGHWTISARRGDEILATGEIDVKAAETIPITLTVGGDKKP